MFNIAQFRKFDLLLLINVMSSSPRGVVNMLLARRPANHFEYEVGFARVGAAEAWNERTQELSWS